jgi:hypothetical protein
MPAATPPAATAVCIDSVQCFDTSATAYTGCLSPTMATAFKLLSATRQLRHKLSARGQRSPACATTFLQHLHRIVVAYFKFPTHPLDILFLTASDWLLDRVGPPPGPGPAARPRVRSQTPYNSDWFKPTATSGMDLTGFDNRNPAPPCHGRGGTRPVPSEAGPAPRGRPGPGSASLTHRPRQRPARLGYGPTYGPTTSHVTRIRPD